MKTLIISPVYSGISIGGVERYVDNLINYCCQKNLEAIFLLPTNKEDSLEKIGNVLIYKRNFLELSYKKISDKKQIPENELKEKARDFFLFVKDLLDEHKIDIVNAENLYLDFPPIYSLILNMVCFTKNIPLVLRAHSFAGTEMEISLVNGLFWDKVICVSKSVTGDFFGKGVNINKLDTHYLGVNTKEFKPTANGCKLISKLKLPKDAKVVLHASRITDGKKDILKEKGIIALLEAFSQLAPKNENLFLLIATARAPKKFREEFNQALDKLNGYIQLHNLTGRVICKEFELEDMACVYNGADLFVLASENETFGLVYIEAMACGTPVIGTNIGGIPEVITDNFDGFLVEPDNPSMLAQRIEKIIYDDEERKKFVKNALKTVRRKFSTERQFGLLFKTFEKIVNSKKIQPKTTAK
jgi:glycosyltransferase involved in cell wall biosynthesis